MPILPKWLMKYWLHIVVALVVLTCAWFLWKPKPPVPEVYKPEQRQADGSVVLEKKPDAEAKPAMEIPKGAKVERVIKLTVQGKNPLQTISGSLEMKETISRMEKTYSADESPVVSETVATECPPVTIDLALVRMPDETRRVIASSPDGEILGGVDIPVEAARPLPKEKVWAAGLVIDPFKQAYGGFVDRDFGWLRIGAQVNQRNQGDIPNQGWVKAGIRF